MELRAFARFTSRMNFCNPPFLPPRYAIVLDFTIMARTVSVEAIEATGTDDIDGTVVDGIEALRQRITQAIRFRFETWFLQRQRGLDYSVIIGHRISAPLAASALNAAVREEGGGEVTGITDVSFSVDRAARRYRYSAVAQTVYGAMNLSETLG